MPLSALSTALLISGTDTGVGKTLVTAALAAYLQTHCSQQRLAIFKPIQSGPGDCEWYAQQFVLTQTLDQITPIHLEQPLAPPIAAIAEDRTIDLALAWKRFQDLQTDYDWILVEGVGGLGSPVTAELTGADLARDWHLPTLLVVPVRLGAIGQAIAHVAFARKANVNLRGLILSCQEVDSADKLTQWAPTDLIESMTQSPILGIMPYIESPIDLNHLAKAAAQWQLERILPNFLPFRSKIRHPASE